MVAWSTAYLETRSRRVGKKVRNTETCPEDGVYSEELGGAGGVARSIWVEQNRTVGVA